MNDTFISSIENAISYAKIGLLFDYFIHECCAELKNRFLFYWKLENIYVFYNVFYRTDRYYRLARILCDFPHINAISQTLFIQLKIYWWLKRITLPYSIWFATPTCTHTHTCKCIWYDQFLFLYLRAANICGCVTNYMFHDDPLPGIFILCVCVYNVHWYDIAQNHRRSR